MYILGELLPRYDVIIVGSGIFGLASAYHILRTDPSLKVLIIDKYPGPGMGNTAKSAAAFRVFFSSEVNYKLAKSSVMYYLDLSKKGVDLGIKMVGYLWLESEESFNEKMEVLSKLKFQLEYKILDESNLLKAIKVNTRVSTLEEAKLMGLHDVKYGIFVPLAGFLDADKLVKYYYNELNELNCEFKFNSKVAKLILEPKDGLGIPGEPFIWQDKRIGGVMLETGEKIFSDMVVTATGAWTSQLLDQVGIDAHVKPKKRQIFVVKAVSDALLKLLESRGVNNIGMPFTILPKPRIYIRPEFEGKSFWISYSDDLGRPYEFEEEPIPEREFYTKGIYQVLIQYFPQFKDVYPYNMWAGYYTYSTIDKQPIVFRSDDLIIVTGGSGSGIMKGDAIGRVAAALFYDKKIATLYGGIKFPVRYLSIIGRKIEVEKFVL